MEKDMLILLAKIESKLNLLLVMASAFESQIPTVVVRIRQAQAHLQTADSSSLFFDLDWITKNILGRKALRKHFEYQTLDLNVLKEELGKYLRSEKLASSLAEAVKNNRKKLFKAFKVVEEDFLILSQRAREEKLTVFYKPVVDFLNIEAELKKEFLSASLTDELDLIEQIGLLATPLEKINSIIRNNIIPKSEVFSSLKWGILNNWEVLLKVMAKILNENYVKTNSKSIARIRKTLNGIAYLEIQR